MTKIEKYYRTYRWKAGGKSEGILEMADE